MARPLRLLALSAFLISAAAVAQDGPDCAVVEWSSAHGHYHCVDGGRYVDAVRHDAVRYYDPRPVVAPRVFIDLSFNRYPYGWRRYGNHWGWHAAPRFYRPVFYAPPRCAYGPYCGHSHLRY